MNRSEILKALEWVDQTARNGDAFLLEKAKLALEAELSSKRNTETPERAYKIAVESFVENTGENPWRT